MPWRFGLYRLAAVVVEPQIGRPKRNRNQVKAGRKASRKNR